MLTTLLLVALALSASAQPSTITFVNEHAQPVRLLWIDGAGGETLLQTLAPSDVTSLSSHLSHQFRARDASGALIGSFRVAHPNERFVIVGAVQKLASDQTPFERKWFLRETLLRMCKPLPHEAILIKQADDLHRRYEMDRQGNERRREQLNRDQPALVPTFTEKGFTMTKVPDALWKDIQNFWKANKNKAVSENWDKGNSYVNHWEIQPRMAYLSQSMKDKTFKAIKPVLEEWAGTELVPTACYGIRLYHRGNRLKNHVDRLDTHAISAIINVDQDIDEPWPLAIMDHNDTMHQIIIAPGDMVLYESASRIHGRPSPFKGNFFANMFVHYRPHKWVDTRI